MSASATLVSGAAGRYATALFDLSSEGNAISPVENDLVALEAALAESPELRAMIRSPLYEREEQEAAFGKICEKMDLGVYATNAVRLLAANRRLALLPEVIAGYKALSAEARGEEKVEITSAAPLSDAQLDGLKDTLRKSVGKDIAVTLKVDESLIGGLIVKVGSKMIDTSIRAKLNHLQNAMKEVG